jgi:uncharacterized protein (TIGR03790 family)
MILTWHPFCTDIQAMRSSWRCLLVLTFLAIPATSRAQSADNILLVINEAVPASVQVGDYYTRKRAVPQDHIVRIKAPITEAISRTEYDRSIETPIALWLARHDLQDKVLYFVLTKGVPIRINGTDGREGSTASVDSELTLLYRKMAGTPSPVVGRVPNPYYLDEKPISEAKPFTRVLSDVYLVTRLDGFTVDDVLKLIDRGSSAAQQGTVVLDEKNSLIDRGGDQWLDQAAERLRAIGAGDRVLLEVTPAVAATPNPVIGYYSWGSNDPANKLRNLGLTFVPGAIGGMFVSTDGRTFVEPKPDWLPGGGAQSAGGGTQSLAGDLIREGITGVSAHVAEPYLDATIRPQVLFPAYLAGFNLAESFYLGMPYLSWQTMVIGDPLCAPFRKKTLTADEIAKGIDPETELPALFSARKLAAIGKNGMNPEALKITLKVEARIAKENRAEIEKLYERATELEPRLTVIQFLLASLYESRNEYDKAMDRYRLILAVEPQNGLALNNMAYDLAERQHLPKDALPYAEKAYRAMPEASVADTLGWIHHLLGDDRTAAPLLERAAAALPRLVDVQVHAATVHAALNDLVRARKDLDAALKADPKAGDRADVKALVDKIK